MAWLATEVPIILWDTTNGGFDTGSHTVEIYPTTETYPTDKIACTQLAILYQYTPDSAPTGGLHYHVRVDGTDIGVLFAKGSRPAVV